MGQEEEGGDGMGFPHSQLLKTPITINSPFSPSRRRWESELREVWVQHKRSEIQSWIPGKFRGWWGRAETKSPFLESNKKWYRCKILQIWERCGGAVGILVVENTMVGIPWWGYHGGNTGPGIHRERRLRVQHQDGVWWDRPGTGSCGVRADTRVCLEVTAAGKMGKCHKTRLEISRKVENCEVRKK